MRALYFLFDLFADLLMYAFILRVWMRAQRIPGFDPLARAIYKFTDRFVKPVRRVAPDIKRLEVAGVLVTIVVVFGLLFITSAVFGCPLNSAIDWWQQMLLTLFTTVLRLTSFLLLLYIILSWIDPHGMQPIHSTIKRLVSPIMRPVRRVIKPMGGIDFAPLIPLVLIGALLVQFSPLARCFS